MTPHTERAKAARKAAIAVRDALRLTGGEVGLVLGTGWNDAIDMKESATLPLADVPGFDDLARLEGHPRTLVKGTVAGRHVLALRGRIHLNEHPSDPRLPEMVRLQAELFSALGIRRLVVTCGAGSLSSSVRVGDIVVIDGFVTCFAPPLPLYAGEFCSPEDALDKGLIDLAFGSDCTGPDRGKVKRGGYLMLRGPQFEGRKYEKSFLGITGARVVGMSVLPEVAVASLSRDMRVLALAYVTNDMREKHSHATNVARAKAESARLVGYLGRVLDRLPP